MTLIDAYKILDIDCYASEQDLKDNFRWLVKFYHPDNMDTADAHEFKKIIEAFNLVKGMRSWKIHL